MKDKVVDCCMIGMNVILTASQANERLQTIQLILNIISIVIVIAINLLRWYHSSKQDGKITIDELEEGANIIKDGIDEIKGAIKQERNEENENWWNHYKFI